MPTGHGMVLNFPIRKISWNDFQPTCPSFKRAAPDGDRYLRNGETTKQYHDSDLVGNCAINPFPWIPMCRRIHAPSWSPNSYSAVVLRAIRLGLLTRQIFCWSKRSSGFQACSKDICKKPSGVTCDGFFSHSNVSKAPKALVPSEWITPDMSEAASKSVASDLALMLPVCNKRSISRGRNKRSHSPGSAQVVKHMESAQIWLNSNGLCSTMLNLHKLHKQHSS